MSRTIFVQNKSKHPQKFEVHGWNNNQDLVVKAHSLHKIKAPNGSSGAIIALHNGFEGEQAEITKDGFGGNDFFDLSNIVGAGGNMTVMQVGFPGTLKGDLLFMQHLNHAFHKASDDLKHKVRGALHFNKKGQVIRLEPIKSHPEIEALIRTFANGKTYISEGAWNGSPGHKSDNNQSKAGHGNRNIIVTYSDGNATPEKHWRKKHHGRPGTAVAGGQVIRVSMSGASAEDDPETIDEDHWIDEADADLLIEDEEFTASLEAENTATSVVDEADAVGAPADEFDSDDSDEDDSSADSPPSIRPSESILAHRTTVSPEGEAAIAADADANDRDNGHQPGILIHNQSGHADTYFFFNNYWNGNGTGGANFDHPMKSVHVGAGQTKFAHIEMHFKGRVQRGRIQPATWVEFQMRATNDHAAHGDISVEQGNDGPATIEATHAPQQPTGGFKRGLIGGAPAAAKIRRSDGKEVLASTMGNWTGPPNQAAIAYQRPLIGDTTYVVGGTGVPDVKAANHRFRVTFY